MRVLADPDARWELLSEAGRVTAEGVVAARDGRLYLVDLTAGLDPNPDGTLFRYDPATRELVRLMEPSGMANGLHVARDGHLYICQGPYGGARAIARRDLATGEVTTLATSYRGKRFVGPNDLTSDAQGRIYFTDSVFNSTEPPELPNAVYRLDPDGTVTQLSTDLIRPNGIEVSPDGTRLYVADSVSSKLRVNPHGPAVDSFGITCGGIAVYDLDRNGTISNGRLFFRTEVAMTDGMAMDTDGNLYAAHHDKPNRLVVALNPDGDVIEEFPLPEKGLTNQLGFGRGADAGTLYMTTAHPWGLYAIKTTKTGHYF